MRNGDSGGPLLDLGMLSFLLSDLVQAQSQPRATFKHTQSLQSSLSKQPRMASRTADCSTFNTASAIQYREVASIFKVELGI